MADDRLDETVPTPAPARLEAEAPRKRARPVTPSTGRLRPLAVEQICLLDGFWHERQTRNAGATIPHCDRWILRMGWLANFHVAADGRGPSDRQGREFTDTAVYNLLEALAWESARAANISADARFGEIARIVASAQRPDGYLNTNFGQPGARPRYSDLEWGHELFCIGHLLQAGVARAQAVGLDDQLVAVAVRAADHVCKTFGPNGVTAICGHPEIEMALVEFYRLTGQRRYLEQARLFIERRGRGLLRAGEFGAQYFQDDIPIREAHVLHGHAVRALYLAAGAVDVAVETDDTELLNAVVDQWENTVARRTYITGGMGSRHFGESFGDDYELSPDRAYCETCAGVASIMLCWRLLLATGEARFADHIERALFNIVATSPGDDGTSFFYTNTLHRRIAGEVGDGDTASERAASGQRAPWYTVACCPTNLARLFASLGAYVATSSATGIQIHQYATARITAELDGDAVELEVRTSYPHDGRVTVRVHETPARPWTLSMRVPAWASGASMTVAGAVLAPQGGYLSAERTWQPGDEAVLDLPIRPRWTYAPDEIDAIRGCVALERGPVVYCVERPAEQTPHGQNFDINQIVINTDVEAQPCDRDAGTADSDAWLAEGSQRLEPDGDGSAWPYQPQPAVSRVTPARIVFTPYHSWGNRGPSTMRVWVPVGPPATGATS